MKQWFWAFKKQNITHRDYRPYFKPVLCYLEGAWTTSTDIEESFESDRHFIDAASWHDLQEKIRFTSYSGRKEPKENYAYLPTKIMNLINGSVPVVAQWNYRILCHPLERDVPLNRLKVVNDIATRMASRRSGKDYAESRAARFQINPVDSDTWLDKPKRSHHQFLDTLMGEVPGKDNYPAKLRDDAFLDGLAYPFKGDKNQSLNVGFYHRVFRSEYMDAMGRDTRRRGYNDQNVFMAATTNPQVAPMTTTRCDDKNCRTITERWTYAIPLEMIYLTPLSHWNPYNIQYKGTQKTALGKTVVAKGRNGSKFPDKAYNGTNSKIYFMTPHTFFTSGEIHPDPADTSGNVKGVLDQSGTLRLMRSTGVRIFLPNIDGVGVIRQRYPIMPIHVEGSTIYKEIEALKDLVLEPHKHDYMLE